MSNVTKNVKKALSALVFFYIKWTVLVLFLIYLLTGFYKVSQSETGVVTRFGKIIANNVSPGLHYTLPYPFSKVIKIAVKQMKTISNNDFADTDWKKGSHVYKYVERTGLRPYSISGDNNIVNISFRIKYTISDTGKYLFNIEDHDKVIGRISSTAMVHSLSKKSVDEILTFGKRSIETEVKRETQKRLDELDSGILVSFTEIKAVSPPTEIQSFFDKVINAEVEKKKLLNNAEAFKNSAVPKARTEANQMTQEARTFKREKILHAEGKAARFLSKLEEYKKSKKITKRKIYLDFLSEIYPKVKEIRFVDPKSGKNRRFSF